MNNRVSATVLIVLFLVLIWLELSPISDGYKYRTAIAECQKSLPRDKQCRVIGVIDQEK